MSQSQFSSHKGPQKKLKLHGIMTSAKKSVDKCFFYRIIFNIVITSNYEQLQSFKDLL